MLFFCLFLTDKFKMKIKCNFFNFLMTHSLRNDGLEHYFLPSCFCKPKHESRNIHRNF